MDGPGDTYKALTTRTHVELTVEDRQQLATARQRVTLAAEQHLQKCLPELQLRPSLVSRAQRNHYRTVLPHSGNLPSLPREIDQQMKKLFIDLATIWGRHDRLVDSRSLPHARARHPATFVADEQVIIAQAHARLQHEAESRGGVDTIVRQSFLIEQANERHAQEFAQIDIDRRLEGGTESAEAVAKLVELVRRATEAEALRAAEVRRREVAREVARLEQVASPGWFTPPFARGPSRPTRELRRSAPEAPTYHGKGKGRVP